MLPLRYETRTYPTGHRIARDPDGVEVYEVIDPHTVEPLIFETTNLENPVFVRFINCRTETDFLRFCDRFAGWPKMAANDLVQARDELRESTTALLSLPTMDGSTTPDLRAMNALLDKGKGIQLRPMFRRYDGASRMILVVASLWNFMTLEVAAAFEAGALMRSCEHCKGAFLVGPQTRRRSDARFCSDRCRVAAMRTRNAAK